MAFQIIQVTRENASCLKQIAVDVFDAIPDPALVDAYVAASNQALFVAIADTEVVGQARGVLHLQPDQRSDLYIDNLGVTPSLQRQGVATRLVKSLIEWGQARGARAIWVATEADNKEARAFYAAAGFKGETVAYYTQEPPDRD